jgi:hypothetical protein
VKVLPLKAIFTVIAGQARNDARIRTDMKNCFYQKQAGHAGTKKLVKTSHLS